MTEEEILKIKYSLSDRLPWPVSVRIQLLTHKKLLKEFGQKWDIHDTAKLLDKKFHDVKSAIDLAEAMEVYPDLAKITNRRRAWRICKLYKNYGPDGLRLKVAQEIQKQLGYERRSTYDDLKPSEVTI